MIEIDNIRNLKTGKSKRIFLFIAFLSITLEIGLLYLIDFNKWADSELIYEIIKEILINLIATTLTAVILVIILFYLMPSETDIKEIDVLDPGKTRKEHRVALNKTLFWNHNGHLGRWVRTDALPALLNKAANGSVTKANLIILNPKNLSICQAYFTYRQEMKFKEKNINCIEDVQAELLATIIAAYTFDKSPGSLKVNLYLKNQFSILREDISSYVAFRTQINPAANCLAFYNKNDENTDSPFYNAANKNYEILTSQCQNIDFNVDINFTVPQNLSTGQVKEFLRKVNLLIRDDEEFLNNVKNRFLSDYHPYT